MSALLSEVTLADLSPTERRDFLAQVAREVAAGIRQAEQLDDLVLHSIDEVKRRTGLKSVETIAKRMPVRDEGGKYFVRHSDLVAYLSKEGSRRE